MIRIISLSLFAVLTAVFFAAATSTPIAAGPIATASANIAAKSANRHNVHYRKKYHRHRKYRRYGRKYRHYRRYRKNRVVRAPFTRVETGRRVIVDAPFAHVRVGRGVRVRAPFVDLWIPRSRRYYY